MSCVPFKICNLDFQFIFKMIVTTVNDLHTKQPLFTEKYRFLSARIKVARLDFFGGIPPKFEH